MVPRIGSFFTCFALLDVTQAYERYIDYLPNARSFTVDDDALGHVSHRGGGGINAFGKDFQRANHKWTRALCEKDSDLDGISNGAELGDPCCFWSVDEPTELITDMLSLPGNPNGRTKNPDLLNPKCKSKKAEGAIFVENLTSSDSPDQVASDVLVAPPRKSSNTETRGNATAGSEPGIQSSTATMTSLSLSPVIFGGVLVALAWG